MIIAKENVHLPTDITFIEPTRLFRVLYFLLGAASKRMLAQRSLGDTQTMPTFNNKMYVVLGIIKILHKLVLSCTT